MYDDIIYLLRKHLNNAWKKKRIKIKSPATTVIDDDTYNIIKTKLDATNVALRAIDKNDEVNKLFKNRREFQAILLRVERDVDDIHERITTNSSGEFVVESFIINTFLQLSKDMNQLRGLVDGMNIDDLLNSIKNSKIILKRENPSKTNNNNNIYRIDESDKIG